MSEETGIERLTKKNFKYFIDRAERLRDEASIEGVYCAIALVYYNPTDESTARILRHTGDTCCLSAVLAQFSADIVSEEPEKEC